MRAEPLPRVFTESRKNSIRWRRFHQGGNLKNETKSSGGLQTKKDNPDTVRFVGSIVRMPSLIAKRTRSTECDAPVRERSSFK